MNVTNGNSTSESPDMPAAEMSALVARLFDKYGRVLLADRRRLYGLLRDYAPTQLRKTKLMMIAYDQGVPQNFAAEDIAPTSFAVAQATQSIIAEAGIQTELAQWAIDAWLGAFFPPKPPLVVQPPEIVIAPTAPPPAPVAAELAPPNATPANDLTWGESEPVIPAAILIAPSAATHTQMAIAPSAQVAPPQAPATPTATDLRQPLSQKSGAAKSVPALYITAVVAAAGLFFYRNYEASSRHVAPVPVPTEQPAAIPVAPTPAPSPSNVVVLSTSGNEKDWPVFANGVILNATPNTWQFRFNLHHPNGHNYGYTASVRLQDDLKTGNATVSASDFQNYKTEAVSDSPVFPVVRVLSNDKKNYITVVNMSGWQKNPAQAPLICVNFTSGATARKFEPDHGIFCVNEFINNTCGIDLGCGRLQ